MTTLADTQQQLFHYLQGKASNIDALVTGKSSLDTQRRLNIYREAYQLRLHDNLCKQFPVLRAYLRGPAFEQLAQAYLQAHPPTHFAIRCYGEHLAAFLRDYDARAYVAELAELEWSLMAMLDQTPTYPVLTTQDLAQLAPERLSDSRFTLQSHWCLRLFHYGTPPWRDALQKNAKASPPQPLAAPIYYALWRQGYQSYYRALSALEAQLAQALQQGQSFAELCELAAADVEPSQAAQWVVQTLLTWIQDGWFRADALFTA